MAKLVKFKDGKFVCWSRVDLGNGDPIWISVARSGVMIKKSKWGFLGEKLYRANDYEANLTAAALIAIYLDEGIPEEDDLLNNMTNPLLRTFTLEAMVSESAFQLSKRLNSDLQALARERTLQSAEILLNKIDNRVLEPVNEQSNKSEKNSKTPFINKQNAE